MKLNRNISVTFLITIEIFLFPVFNKTTVSNSEQWYQYQAWHTNLSREKKGGKKKRGKRKGERGKDHDNRKYYNFVISASQALWFRAKCRSVTFQLVLKYFGHGVFSMYAVSFKFPKPWKDGAFTAGKGKAEENGKKKLQRKWKTLPGEINNYFFLIVNYNSN